ncbi:Competence protein A [Planctomycetes bacterium MalM25]|nr:Competence protein A [Planctomycetes bacterium MalM25]
MLGWNRNGWIGFDVGERAVKLAQLQRTPEGLRLVSASISDRGAGSVVDDAKAAKALAGTLRGRQTAATLSMRECRLEPTDPDAPPEPRRCADHWESGSGGAYTLSYPAEQVEATVEGLAQAGMQCEVIDGAPLAIARVLTLSDNYRPDELIGALDWGETAVSFVAASGGQARYARRLTTGAFGDLRLRVGEELGLNHAESDRLLARYGEPENALKGDEDRMVRELLRDAVRPLAQELKRTYEHLGGKLKTKPPQRCLLLGAGGASPALAPTLAALAELRVEPWRAVGIERDASNEELPDCLLAQAIALSALAWEARV